MMIPSTSSGYVSQGEMACPSFTLRCGRGARVAQKREVAKAITDAMVRITNTTPEATFVIFTDVAKENWAQAGELASET